MWSCFCLLISCCRCFVVLSFFFLMIRRPPRSTLFPTRRSSDLHAEQTPAIRGFHAGRRVADLQGGCTNGCRSWLGWNIPIRSEEHTSELQSRRDLVCRLLLEKKKITNSPKNYIKICRRTTCTSS